MKQIGWLINGVFYRIEDEKRVDAIRRHSPNPPQILPIYAKEDVCIKY